MHDRASIGPNPPDWQRILATAARRRWIVLGGILLGVAGSVLLGGAVRPTYEVHSTLWIGPTATDAPGPFERASLFGPRGWVDLARSFAVLDPAVRELGLEGEPREVADRISRDLDVRIEESFLDVRLRGKDPERITAIVNAVSRAYVRTATELKRAQLEETTAVLGEQLRAARETLRESELTLEEFRVRTISRPADEDGITVSGIEETRRPVFESFHRARMEAEELRRDQVALERAVERLGRGEPLAVEALETIPSVRRSSELVEVLEAVSRKRVEARSLGLVLLDGHPDLEQVRDELRMLEEDVGPRLVRTLANELGDRRRALEIAVERVAEELRDIPPHFVQEARLERELRSAEQLFDHLLARYEAARLELVGTAPDVRVLDHAAVPGTPASDARARVRVLLLLMGLGLGLWGAVLRDRMDGRVRTPEQVVQGLGLPILGGIPRARALAAGGSRWGSRDALPAADGGSSEELERAIEAFRGLRLALGHATSGSGPPVITITSPGMGDGKSFTASNLAFACAELGRRTLLIDGDVRRGRIHDLLDVDRRPGLTDHLAGRADLEDVVRPGGHPFLDVIPSGSRLRDAPELLGNGTMRSLLDRARAAWDVILVDSPPLGAAADPLLLGTLSNGLLLVLRMGATNRTMAGARLTDLDRLSIPVLGAVLNDIPTDLGSYGYMDYLPGYGPGSEEARSGDRDVDLVTSSEGRLTG